MSTSVRRSFAIQMRIVHALLLREIITRYGRHGLGFLWLFCEPMLFTGGVLAIRLAFHFHEGPLPLAPFCISGYATVLAWRNGIGRCGTAIEPNRSLTYHRNVRVIDLYAARILLELAGTTMSFLFLYSLLLAFGLVPVPYDLLSMLGAWALLCGFITAMALVIGPLSSLSESFDRLWHVFSYLFLPASGAFFTVSMLPTGVRGAALWVPTVTVTELLRYGIFGPGFAAKYAVGYVLAVTLVLLVPGLFLVRHVQRSLEGA